MIELLDGVTNTDAIRAVIGVGEDANELPDSYFLARKMEGALRLELSTWLPETLEYLQESASTALEGDTEVLVWDAVQQAAGYWCAWQVCRTAPIALFQRLSDGQNQVQRTQFNLEELLEQLRGGYLENRDRVLDLSNVAPTANTAWMFGIASPTFDPVTG